MVSRAAAVRRAPCGKTAENVLPWPSLLTNATLPYVMKLASLGWQDALRSDPALAKGLNTHAGEVTYAAVAEAFGLENRPVASLL